MIVGAARIHTGHPRGQTLAEFALVLPILLVLLLAVADFGRVFAASISAEASARDAAEIGAIERLRNKPNFGDSSTWIAYYTTLHEQIAKVVCSELSVLPNTTFNSTDRTCPSMPLIGVCIRDDMDPICGGPIYGFASTIPGQCSNLAEPWSNASGDPDDPNVGPADTSYAFEVRVCYRFTTLFNLHFTLPGNVGLDLGEIWIQRERVFALDCPPGDVSTC